jgi:hypothetical protein
MRFTTYRIADISTKYITKSDGQKIGNKESPGHIASIDGFDGGSPGDIFSVPQNRADMDLRREDLISAGFSIHFVKIIKELSRGKIEYVRFDRDGADIEGSETFNW